jgi:hypothetical protein
MKDGSNFFSTQRNKHKTLMNLDKRGNGDSFQPKCKEVQQRSSFKTKNIKCPFDDLF